MGRSGPRPPARRRPLRSYGGRRLERRGRGHDHGYGRTPSPDHFDRLTVDGKSGSAAGRAAFLRDLYGDKGYVDGGRKHRLKVGRYTSNARLGKANHGPPVRGGATPALRGSAPRSNTSSPPWRRWAENGYRASVWIERPSNSRGKPPPTISAAYAVLRRAVWSPSDARGVSGIAVSSDSGQKICLLDRRETQASRD